MQNDTDRRYRETLANGVLTGDRPIFDTGSMFGQHDRDGVDQLLQPIMLYTPITGRDESTGEPTTFVRGSQAVRPDGMLMGNNIAIVSDGYNLLEGSATSYYAQTYTTSASGILTTNAPTTQTITLPANRSYVLWCKGGAGLSVTIAAGTAAGTGWGTITTDGYLALNITTAGTVTVTPTGAAAGDQVQLTTGIVPTSFIPTPTTSPVTRASDGSDTPGNGLSIALSQAMIDSLQGECQDFSVGWTEEGSGGPYATVSSDNRSITFTPGFGANRALYKVPGSLNLTLETKYEYSITITGRTQGSVYIRSGQSYGIVRSANGTYTERLVCKSSATTYIIAQNNFDGTITINYVRRVLENGQTNPGAGTICQWVDLPWPSSAVPNSAFIGVLATNSSAFGVQTIYRSSGGLLSAARAADGVSSASIKTEFAPGRYCLISQWSAALGRMRVGLYNPATGALTWSQDTLAGGAPYRGFFPIYGTGDQQRMRWFYGGGSYPVGIGPMLWYNSIITDDMLIWAAREVQP